MSKEEQKLTINQLEKLKELNEKTRIAFRIEELNDWILQHKFTHPDFESKVRELNTCTMRLAIKNNDKLTID